MIVYLVGGVAAFICLSVLCKIMLGAEGNRQLEMDPRRTTSNADGSDTKPVPSNRPNIDRSAPAPQ